MMDRRNDIMKKMRKYEDEKLHPIRKTLNLDICTNQGYITLEDRSVIAPVEVEKFEIVGDQMAENQHMPEGHHGEQEVEVELVLNCPPSPVKQDSENTPK